MRSSAELRDAKPPEQHARLPQSERKTYRQIHERTQPDLHVVRRGDTLSEIVHARLRQSGQRVSRSELYARVHEVAHANGIDNPDVIAVGQSIRLDVLSATSRPVRGEAFEAAVASSTGHAAPLTLERIVPGQARISSGFGTRIDPFDGSPREHRGIDIAARQGTPIHPAADGTVVFAGKRGGHGMTVIVRHPDGTETLYAHADKLLVQEGDPVRTSDKLGLVGSTGRSTGPHLHFEVHRNGVAVDPLALLTAEVGD